MNKEKSIDVYKSIMRRFQDFDRGFKMMRYEEEGSTNSWVQGIRYAIYDYMDEGLIDKKDLEDKFWLRASLHIGNRGEYNGLDRGSADFRGFVEQGYREFIDLIPILLKNYNEYLNQKEEI